MTEPEIRAFWEAHPCGDQQVGGMASFDSDLKSFFDAYDKFRYVDEAHIPGCLDRLAVEGKKTLEIGLGEGAESEQLIRRGAAWSGLDLTAEAVRRVETRLGLRQLPFDAIKQGSALDIPYPDASFDLVFSHGVLHHVPDIQRAQSEIYRVLKPEGRLTVMMYAKYSLNYLLAIAILRRLGLIALWFFPSFARGIYREHLENARAAGLGSYLKMENFIHRNTDGPHNPYAKVYSLETIRQDFPDFEIVEAWKEHMHAPPLPVKKLPLGHLLGWHLWVTMKPKPRIGPR